MPPSWEGVRRRQKLKQVQGADGCDELGAKERATRGGEKLMKAPPGVGHQGRKKSARKDSGSLTENEDRESKILRRIRWKGRQWHGKSQTARESRWRDPQLTELGLFWGGVGASVLEKS